MFSSFQDILGSSLVEQLMTKGLVVNVDKLQLSSNYAPQRHQSIFSEQLAQRLGVKLGVNTANQGRGLDGFIASFSILLDATQNIC